jgi:pimeloyl-ACP methyl ester carboxylesterase
LADRNHLLHADINLSTHIQEIVSLVKFEELNNVILCGQSYSGMIISSVTDRISERISSLVYLDAWLPKDGDAIMTLGSWSISKERRIRTVAVPAWVKQGIDAWMTAARIKGAFAGGDGTATELRTGQSRPSSLTFA